MYSLLKARFLLINGIIDIFGFVFLNRIQNLPTLGITGALALSLIPSLLVSTFFLTRVTAKTRKIVIVIGCFLFLICGVVFFYFQSELEDNKILVPTFNEENVIYKEYLKGKHYTREASSFLASSPNTTESELLHSFENNVSEVWTKESINDNILKTLIWLAILNVLLVSTITILLETLMKKSTRGRK